MSITDVSSATQRVRSGTPLYGEISDALIDEAALLDDDRYVDWIGLLAPDIVYSWPLRSTVYRRAGAGFDARVGHINCTYDMLVLRARNEGAVEIETAWHRDPAPRIRRQISNVVIRETENPEEYQVVSYIVAHRNRADLPETDIITGKREDIWRRDADGTFKLARRTIYTDHTLLKGYYLNLIL